MQCNIFVSCYFNQVFGSRVRVDSTAKVAQLEEAEKVTLNQYLCAMNISKRSDIV